ncbi:hypothetical protein, partial [Pseudomonas viridiflava]|uniref:hypothetical protein n=1 Tax=Pseudomonas viridiflava TaxID=33069 RepID=UPI00197D846A
YTLWKQEHGVKPNAAAESKRLEQQKARQAEREARRAADEEAEKVRAQRIYAERMAYEHTWLTGERSEFEYEGTRKDGGGSYIGKGFIEAIGDEDGTAPYLVKKQ